MVRYPRWQTSGGTRRTASSCAWWRRIAPPLRSATRKVSGGRGLPTCCSDRVSVSCTYLHVLISCTYLHVLISCTYITSLIHTVTYTCLEYLYRVPVTCTYIISLVHALVSGTYSIPVLVNLKMCLQYHWQLFFLFRCYII